MRRLRIISILLILIPAAAFCTEFSTGLTYDAYTTPFSIGTDFSMKESFENGSSILVNIDYQNNSTYEASFTYDLAISRYTLSGGLAYDINEKRIIPDLIMGAGVSFPVITAATTAIVGINPYNVFMPNTFSIKGDIVIHSKEANLEINALYSDEHPSYWIQKYGGGFVFNTFQEGVPATVDLFGTILHVKDTLTSKQGLLLQTGGAIHVTINGMVFSLSGMADLLSPYRRIGTSTAYSISLDWSFKL